MMYVVSSKYDHLHQAVKLRVVIRTDNLHEGTWLVRRDIIDNDSWVGQLLTDIVVSVTREFSWIDRDILYKELWAEVLKYRPSSEIEVQSIDMVYCSNCFDCTQHLLGKQTKQCLKCQRISCEPT